MSPREFQEWKQYAESLRSFGHDRAFVFGQMTIAKCGEQDANSVLDGLFGAAEPAPSKPNGHSKDALDAFQAVKQPPAKMVPVESIVPPPDREATKTERAFAEAQLDPLPDVPAVMKAQRQWVRWRLETVE